MSGEAPLIEIAGVSKRFGAVSAIDGVSLEVRENEFFALLGPSGSGKTTLLRLLAGFERPDSGTIRLDGHDLIEVRANHRPLNMMFQSYALFPHLSVYDNVAYGLRMEKVRGAALERRVDAALEMVRLTDTARRRPHQLSGGQCQRVALARALIKRPRVLLLDEPLAALDKKLREQMQIELKRLQHEVGITFVLVTHDQREALVMADRIALMNHGRVVQVATARELYEHPRSYFAADFIGVMNFFRGRATQGGVEVEGLGLLAAEVGPAPGGGEAWLAVRPERISLGPGARDRGADNVVSGRLEGVAYFGEDLLVRVRVPGQEKALVVKLGSGASEVMELADGAEVWCAWPAEASRVLFE